MSKKETENREEKKVITKYDLKMQRKEEERKKAKRDELTGRITGIVIVLALLCLVLSFPIRSYLTINGTYIEVAGEKVSRVEFDYHYNLMKNSYITQNSYYLSMFGVDLSDPSAQMYSDQLTFQDYFEQMAVNNIAENKALRDQMKAAGFTYDASEEYAQYEETIKTGASAQGITEKAYIQQMYGPYATASRVKGFVTENMELGAYYELVSQEKAPSEAEIQAYYEENADNYDSVDYRILTINAELPTEPTELADPQDEAEGTEGTEGTDGDKAYTPSEAEIEFAMGEAKNKADEALGDISTLGDLQENVKKSAINSLLQDWLFDSTRKQGDATVIENTTSHLYYVVEFESRYLDQTPTADARIIVLGADSEVTADAVMEEWQNGPATEESFAELADKYGSSVEGGLYEGLTAGGLTDELAAWVLDSSRTGGETVVITGAEETHTDADGSTHTHATAYVAYYVGTNDPAWSLDIEGILLTERMNTYMEEISQGYELTNHKGNLNYVKVQEAANASESGESESQGSEENTDQESGQESSEGSDNGQ